MQKFPARAFAAVTRVDFSSAADGDMAGLVVMGRKYAALVVSAGKMKFIVDGKETIVADAPAPTVDLRVAVKDGGECVFGFSGDGGTFQTISRKFTAREGVWIGARMGIFAINTKTGSKGGFCDFHFFRVAGPIRS